MQKKVKATPEEKNVGLTGLHAWLIQGESTWTMSTFSHSVLHNTECALAAATTLPLAAFHDIHNIYKKSTWVSVPGYPGWFVHILLDNIILLARENKPAYTTKNIVQTRKKGKAPLLFFVGAWDYVRDVKVQNDLT